MMDPTTGILPTRRSSGKVQFVIVTDHHLLDPSWKGDGQPLADLLHRHVLEANHSHIHLVVFPTSGSSSDTLAQAMKAAQCAVDTGKGGIIGAITFTWFCTMQQLDKFNELPVRTAFGSHADTGQHVTMTVIAQDYLGIRSTDSSTTSDAVDATWVLYTELLGLSSRTQHSPDLFLTLRAWEQSTMPDSEIESIVVVSGLGKSERYVPRGASGSQS